MVSSCLDNTKTGYALQTQQGLTLFSYKRHSASFTLLEGQLSLHERLYAEIPLVELEGSSL